MQTPTLFNGKNIRRIRDPIREQRYFSVVDVVSILSQSADGRKYRKVLKGRMKNEGSESVTNCYQLKLPASDGKSYKTDVAEVETIFRIIQSIPSPNAEPFKLWLAKVGYERIEEVEDPELAITRAMNNYLAKGYSEDWINQRLKTIETRKHLTDERKKSGIKQNEYVILTDEITMARAGLRTREYKDLKGLKKENLRDIVNRIGIWTFTLNPNGDLLRANAHSFSLNLKCICYNMSNLELILNMLAEATTTEISQQEQPQSFPESKDIAKRGGNIAGEARKNIEKETGKPVIAGKNNLHVTETKPTENNV